MALFTCWSDPSWLSASLDELIFCTFPACALFLTFVDSGVVCALPRFLTFGLGVTDGVNLKRVDDEMLLELLVEVEKLLFDPGLLAVIDTDSVDCDDDEATNIWKSITFQKKT